MYYRGRLVTRVVSTDAPWEYDRGFEEMFGWIFSHATDIYREGWIVTFVACCPGNVMDDMYKSFLIDAPVLALLRGRRRERRARQGLETDIDF